MVTNQIVWILAHEAFEYRVLTKGILWGDI